MSSEGSVSTDSSRIKQFGLYRTIDARTEEFLRLSRRRQIKQGCACAAVSTAITVTIVIVILLIYEYAIAVESSLVQIGRRGKQRNIGINVTNDSPVADRLDRSYFGFDQDYYERMPLLVNAMQENSYVDSSMDVNVERKEVPRLLPQIKLIMKPKHNLNPPQLRRTSPRPFIFEYKSPTPVPFSKTFASKSWIDSYRNAQRLKNIQQVIKYLERTINAKFGDMYSAPSNNPIAFTGVYLEPGVQGNDNKSSELTGTDTKNIEFINSNHKSDPLFKYKPDSPGEVNLLADNFLRFSPSFTVKKDYTNIPMFKPIPTRKKPCFGYNCGSNQRFVDTKGSFNDNRVSDSSNFGKAKTFSVMLNLIPLKSDLEHSSTKSASSNKVYITTSKPLVLFKRKTTPSTRKITIPIKRPRILYENKKNFAPVQENIEQKEKTVNHTSSGPNISIVQISLYSPEKQNDIATQYYNFSEFFTSTTTELNPFIPISPYTTELPIPNLSSTQVEDFHVGSSGIIPLEARTAPPTTPIFSSVPTTIPPFDVTISSTEGAWYTKPPDILKFSHEDAKIPDSYKQYLESDYIQDASIDINRRNSRDKFHFGDLETQTLVTKLRNHADSTSKAEITTAVVEETTTVTTTTQINGHYRSINRNIKKLSSLLDPNSETNRKRRLNLLAKGFRRADFPLSYTEINRSNKTQTT